MKLKCKDCEHCTQIGRAQTQRNRVGRKYYYCKNPKIKDMKDKWGYPHMGFIGFGEHNNSSPLMIKTSPIWCPLKQIK
jgi:hypothetical protein